MTNQQIKLVKASWKAFQKINPVIVADVFYSKLFADRNSLRRLFPFNMEEQYKKFIEMLDAVVAHIDDLNTMKPAIEEMAIRHVNYGIKVEHYKLVGSALLFMLEKGLGSRWTKEIEAAWTACYTTLSGIMIKAAYSPEN